MMQIPNPYSPFFWLGIFTTGAVFAALKAEQHFNRQNRAAWELGFQVGKEVKEDELSAQSDLRANRDGQIVANEAAGESPAEA